MEKIYRGLHSWDDLMGVSLTFVKFNIITIKSFFFIVVL